MTFVYYRECSLRLGLAQTERVSLKILENYCLFSKGQSNDPFLVKKGCEPLFYGPRDALDSMYKVLVH